MNTIMLYEGKDQKMAWDTSTEELKSKAILSLFRYLDDPTEYNCYKDLRDMQSAIYDRAKKGDAKAAERILMSRTYCEYEHVEFIRLEEEL